jgi:hypothetical protein
LLARVVMVPGLPLSLFLSTPVISVCTCLRACVRAVEQVRVHVCEREREKEGEKERERERERERGGERVVDACMCQSVAGPGVNDRVRGQCVYGRQVQVRALHARQRGISGYLLQTHGHHQQA